MKTVIAVIGGSALVAMGAMTFAITQEQTQSTQMVSSGTMNMGPTSVQETPATPETAVAAPAVKAGSWRISAPRGEDGRDGRRCLRRRVGSRHH